MLDITQNIPFLESPRDYAQADYQYEMLMEQIKEFESTLDQDHEVMLLLSSFGQSVTMLVEEIGYANPSLIFFYGQVNGKDSTLVQHVNQLSFLIISVEKPAERSQPRRIGFGDPDSD